MARDWRFRIASFRGATFYVEEIGPAGGRRKVVHEYPGSETWDVEDMGAKAKRITGSVYFSSETADADFAAFVAACDQAGPGELNIPFFPVSQASNESYEPRWSKEKLNYVGVEVTFIIENPAGAPVVLGLGERIIAGQLAASAGTIGAAISSLFAGIPGTSYQRSDAVAPLSNLAALVETLREATALPDTTNSSAQQTLAALAPTAETIVEGDPGRFVATALEVLDAISIDALPDEAALIFSTMASLAVAMVSPDLESAPDPSQAAVTVPAAGAIAVTMQAIRLTATSTYTDRPTAIDARDAIQALAVAALPFVGSLGPDVTSAFSDLWGKAASYLSSVITNLAPIVLFECNESLPSTVLAYRLYGDPSRGQELVERNRVATPLLMPTLFEAASR